jgi:hypothetical protein
MERRPAGPSEQQKKLGIDIYSRPSAPAPPPAQPSARPSSASKAGRPDAKAAAKPQLQRPIIVVPEGESPMINIRNAGKVLGVRAWRCSYSQGDPLMMG